MSKETIQSIPWLHPRAAYIHVPFCAHHCWYCDFAVAAGKDAHIDRYIDALEHELATLGKAKTLTTLYLGGGTPTHLAPAQLARLLSLVRQWFALEPGYEFSIEANPATLTSDKVAVLAEHGVNRLSLGAQSFQAHTLQFLERDHRAVEIGQAIEVARSRIDNISLDLIFGVPGQTLQQWSADLAHAVALGIDHISTYGLTYEKGTRLWKEREREKVTALDDEAELSMYLEAMDLLEAAGLQQYEISSFARAGRECRHNRVYWANHAYFGLGLGAARYVNGERQINTRDLQSYMRKALAREPVIMQSEKLDPEERARETMSLNLRRREGMDREDFRRQTGFDAELLAGEVIGRHVELGLLEDNGQRVALTRRGRCVADAVISAVCFG